MSNHAHVLAANTQRSVVLAAIGALHVILIYAFSSGLLVRAAAHLAPPDLVASFLPPPTRTHEPPPRPVTPQRLPLLDPGAQFPPPLYEFPGTDDATALSVTPDREPAIITTPAPIVRIGRNVLPDSEDYYPPAARRQGLEGTSEIQACVDGAGRLAGAPTIARSSGSALLDGGALAVVRAGQFARALREGVPVAQCYGFRIVFHLR